MATRPAGARDRRITLQRASIVKNALNEDVTTWLELATVWAEKLDVSDRERVAAAEVAAEITTRFRILWSTNLANLNPKDRLTFDSKVYDIVVAKEMGRREGIEISANARSDL